MPLPSHPYVGITQYNVMEMSEAEHSLSLFFKLFIASAKLDSVKEKLTFCCTGGVIPGMKYLHSKKKFKN